MDDILLLMHTADRIDSGRWLMCCPNHGGGFSSSLEVTLEAGRYTLHCICGCAPEQIMAAAVKRAISKEALDAA